MEKAASPSSQFIREGEKPPSSQKTKKGLQQTAPSWEMKADLEKITFSPRCPNLPEARHNYMV